MKPDARISIAGHRGLVGSAILRNLQAKGYTNFVLRTHAELDLDTTKPDGMERQLPDVSRLHALGWRHKHSMHEGLRSAYEDFLRTLAPHR